MHSCAFEYSVRNSDLYDGVGGFSRTNADFIIFYHISITRIMWPMCRMVLRLSRLKTGRASFWRNFRKRSSHICRRIV